MAAAAAYLPAPAPGLGLELRWRPLGNTFLNWPVVQDDVPPLRRARSCPGLVAFVPAPDAAPVAAARPAPAQGAAPDAADKVEHDALPTTKPSQRASLDRARPAALQLIKEKVVAGQLKEAADDTGCRTASTHCSSTWRGSGSDDGDEWEVSDELAEPGMMSDGKPAESYLAATGWLVQVEEAAKEPQPSAVAPAGKRRKPMVVTTLMIQRLPVLISQADLAEALNEAGFQGQWDFLYMPTSFGTGRGYGYAFLNMVTPHAAQQLVTAWNKGRPFGIHHDVLKITKAHVQGREPTIKKWNTPKMQRVRNPNHKPLIYEPSGLRMMGTLKSSTVSACISTSAELGS